mgnify:CR=1 FL=1
MNLNKTDFVSMLAETVDVSKSMAEDMVNAYHKIVGEALSQGGKVSFTGFGSYQASDRAARTCRNPRTGESIEVPATRVPTFKAGKALKDEVKK